MNLIQRFPILLACSLLTGFGSLYAAAHPSKDNDNEYGIDAHYYDLFDQARKHNANPEVLSAADTLDAVGARLDQPVYRMLSAIVRVFYYFPTEDEEAFGRSVSDMKLWSRKAGYDKLYYKAYINDIRFQLNNQHALLALERAHNMMIEAQQERHDDGIYYALCSTGDIYYMRENYSLAQEYYNKAADYAAEHLPERDLSELYVDISSCFIELQQFDRAVLTCDSVLRTSTNYFVNTALMTNKCLALYDSNRQDEFMTCYDSLAAMNARTDEEGVSMTYVTTHKLLLEQRYDEALSLSDSLPNVSDRYHIQEEIYKHCGDWHSAYECRKQLSIISDSIHDRMQMEDLAVIGGRLDNLLLSQKTEDLELKNRLLIYHACLIIFLVVFVLLCILILNRRRSIRQLKAKNRELEESNARLIAAREETDRALHEASKANEMRTAFMRNVTHEVRTPLNAVLGFAQLVADPSVQMDDATLQQTVAQMQRNSEMLTQLIDNILELSSLESTVSNLQREAVCCNELGREALRQSRCRGVSTDKVRIAFTSDLPDQETLDTHFKKAVSVLVHLVNNALKFTAEGSVTMHCSLADEGQRIVYSVTDTGIGIPAEKAEVIFERFKQLDTFVPGLGLGLSICRMIATELGGEVVLDTNYHGGARFLFTLPK